MSSQPATRDTVLLGALRVLARDGVPDASTRAIAAEAEVNVATLHYHFGSKDALLGEVVSTLSAQLAETVRAAIPTEGGVRDAIESGLRAVLALAGQTAGLQLAQYELTTAALRAGEVDRARTQYASYQGVVAELIEETLAFSGEQLAIAVDDLAGFLVAGMDGLILCGLVMPAERASAALELFITAAVRLADPTPARSALHA